MANYKLMYELMAQQTRLALCLLQQAEISGPGVETRKVCQAIEILEQAQAKADAHYLEQRSKLPFLYGKNFKGKK